MEELWQQFDRIVVFDTIAFCVNWKSPMSMSERCDSMLKS